MNKQELRGEIREQLSETLTMTRAALNDEQLQGYLLGKAAALRGVLALMDKENN